MSSEQDSYYRHVSDILHQKRPPAESPGPRPHWLSGEKIKRALRIAALVLCVLLVVAYVCDYVVIRFRLSRGQNALGSVTIQTYYAMPQKNGKTEIIYGQPETASCIHALFPHSGYSPCWYLSRHTDKRVDI